MFPAYLPDKGLQPFTDGVRIEDVPDLKDRLLQYLEAPSPLQCCRYCLGSVGRLFPHEEVQRRAWREPQQFATEDLIDWEHLQVLEQVDPEEDNLCQRSHLDGVPQ
jgi:hypothetical protein